MIEECVEESKKELKHAQKTIERNQSEKLVQE